MCSELNSGSCTTARLELYSFPKLIAPLEAMFFAEFLFYFILFFCSSMCKTLLATFPTLYNLGKIRSYSSSNWSRR